MFMTYCTLPPPEAHAVRLASYPLACSNIRKNPEITIDRFK